MGDILMHPWSRSHVTDIRRSEPKKAIQRAIMTLGITKEFSKLGAGLSKLNAGLSRVGPLKSSPSSLGNLNSG